MGLSDHESSLKFVSSMLQTETPVRDRRWHSVMSQQL